jgi:hypothetical protein
MTIRGQGLRQRQGRKKVLFPAVTDAEADCVSLFLDDRATQRNSYLTGHHLQDHRLADPGFVDALHFASPS